jgi:hypothetical protein
MNFTLDMDEALITPIIKGRGAINTMAKGKAFELDGIIVIFCVYFWNIISDNYFTMISNSIKKNKIQRESHMPNHFVI